MSIDEGMQIRELDVFAVTDKGVEERKRGSNGLSHAGLELAVMLRLVIASLALGLAGLSVPAAADAERGARLYETRCNACHASSVHQRSARQAKSFDGVRVQVLRWSNEVGGAWTGDEIDDVALYLNQRYYRFPCPPSVCKASQALLAR